MEVINKSIKQIIEIIYIINWYIDLKGNFITFF